MDPEALAPADGGQEVRDATDAPTCGEESERVEPIQESENQRLPELSESVARMAETKVVHTVVALGPGPLNQEAAASAVSGYGGHAFSSDLPGEAMPAMARLSEVSQESDALEEVPQVRWVD